MPPPVNMPPPVRNPRAGNFPGNDNVIVSTPVICSANGSAIGDGGGNASASASANPSRQKPNENCNGEMLTAEGFKASLPKKRTIPR